MVAGAGYAGVVAANRLLSKAPETRVTVVNPRADFVERIRLHQLAAGNHTAVVPLTTVLHPQAQLVIGAVESVEASTGGIRLDDDRRLSYDHLIYAVGSGSRLDRIGGASEHAFDIAEYESAEALRQRAAAVPPGAPVVVIGGGLTGIETAAELAEQRPHVSVTLISDRPVAGDLHEKARAKILRALESLSVEVLEGTAATYIAEGKVELADGRSVASECTVVAAASAVPALARTSGLPADAAGRLTVDRTLTCPAAPNIVGAGDAVSIDGMPLRMSCQAAIPLGAHAADTILRGLRGQTPKDVHPRFLTRSISLGRRCGVVQRTDHSDRPQRTVLGGRVAAFVKEQICSSTVRWGVNPRQPVMYTWS
ncbi:oxidoreductase [Rhodococcus triatomae BKS 15-14]|nr:oxidoreductase [Rhodococcus triatomae BKS 15-14]